MFDKVNEGDIAFQMTSANYTASIPVQIGEDQTTQNVSCEIKFNAKKGTFKVASTINGMAISGNDLDDEKVIAAALKLAKFCTVKAVKLRDDFRQVNPENPDQMEMEFGDDDELGEPANPLPSI